jgi:hypothetical protein
MVAVARRVDEARFVNMNNKQSKEVWEVQSEDVKGSDDMKETWKWWERMEQKGFCVEDA